LHFSRAPVEEYPTFYINPDARIDCGACELECPNAAIFEVELVPADFQAAGGELLTAVEAPIVFTEVYERLSHEGEKVQIPAAKRLASGEVIDLTPSIENNRLFFSEGPGYSTQS